MRSLAVRARGTAGRGAAALIRVEQHPYGPRVYILGQRVHEVALGLGLLALFVGALALHRWRPTDEALLLGGAGVWLVAKDWRDLFPRWRNTQVHRRFGFHDRAGAVRARRPGLPLVAAVATLAVAAVNAASALTPNVGWRGHLLLRFEPVSVLPIFHAVALPASAALALTAVSLYRRRRRALHVAIGLLLVLAVANVLKGLDVEEASISLLLGWALWYGRAAFDVGHDRLRLRAAVAPLAVGGLGVLIAGVVSVWVAGRTDPSVGLAWRETAALLGGGTAPFPLDSRTVPDLVRGLVLFALVAASWSLFRPRRPAVAGGDGERLLAEELVRAHGHDTLAAFKLRDDLRYLFDERRRAFLGYRVEGGVLLVAGDPVGPDDAVDDLVREARAFASAHGLRLGAVGASERMARLWRETGLRTLYLGDEAIVDTRTFSLEGRPIRKVRQSVTRLVTAGYTATVEPVAGLADAELAELEDISRSWRAGQPERGFAMATTLDDPAAREGVVVVARDETGCARGWLHFLPSYGRPAMSLALMRRDRETPNGLSEFLVVRSIELLRERGIDELSLNFAAFARPLRSPSGLADRVLARGLGIASRWFQIESLYRFNAKFFPRWEPRYLMFQGPGGLPRVGLAALIAEGQLPAPLLTLGRAAA